MDNTIKLAFTKLVFTPSSDGKEKQGVTIVDDSLKESIEKTYNIKLNSNISEIYDDETVEERIAKCWNACVGIDSKYLEYGYLGILANTLKIANKELLTFFNAPTFREIVKNNEEMQEVIKVLQKIDGDFSQTEEEMSALEDKEDVAEAERVLAETKPHQWLDFKKLMKKYKTKIGK